MKKKLKPTVSTPLSVSLNDIPAGSDAPEKKNGQTKSSKASLRPNGKVSNGKPRTKNGKDSGLAGLETYYSPDLDSKQLLHVLAQVKEGNFTVRLPDDKIGLSGKICDTLNHIISLNEMLMEELIQAKNTIGKQGHLNHRVALPRYARGSWASGVDSINTLISDLVHPTIEIAHVISSVAKGNLSQEMPLKIGDHVLQGEFAKIAAEVNDMVKQLNLFSMEVTRVAREVGSEGKLGGQAKVKGVAGVWKDLTDSVNQMAGNLTAQVRNIAEVTTAVAKGDLRKKITVDVQGEILELKNTINTMVDQLNSFSAEVTRVAREVGTDGKLGGQAEVKGIGGTWKDLTDSVNQMASNLTGQVRNIAEVTTAVARGEDDSDDREMLTEVFSSIDKSFILLFVNNGKEVLSALEKLHDDQKPCLIVLDYNMPGLNGSEILEEVGQNERYKNIPKIVWSTSGSDKFKKLCLELGAADYVIKPSNHAELEKIAHYMLSFCPV